MSKEILNDLKNYLPEGLYFHSFALNPSSQQPSGSANFSVLDNSELILDFNDNLDEEKLKNVSIIINSKKYNYLRISGTMANLLW